MTKVKYFQVKIVFYVALLGYVLNILYRTMRLGDQTARIFPYIFGIASAIFLILLIASVLIPEAFEEITPSVASGASTPTKDRGNLTWWIIALVSVFPFAVYIVGFLYTIPLYVLLLVYAVKRDIKDAIIASISFTLMWWIVFVRLLHIGFFEGILF